MSSRSRVLVLDPVGGAAAEVGRLTTALDGAASYAVDVNPAADRLRIISSHGQSLRVTLDPDPARPGVLATTVDGSIRRSARIVAAAYDRPTAGTTATTLYDLDAAGSRLVQQDPPKRRNARARRPPRHPAARDRHLRHPGRRRRPAHRHRRPGTAVHAVDLRTGRTTRRGTVPAEVVALTFLPRAARTALLLTAPVVDSSQGQRLQHVDRTSGQSIRSVALTGLEPGERLLGLDVRPATGKLTALTTAQRLVTVVPLTRQVTAGPALSAPVELGPLGIDGVGFDVNPVVDRIRIVTATGRNLRVHPDTGAMTVDGELNGDDTGVVAAGYANPLAGATRTTLYGLTPTDQLVIQAPPNDGRLTRIGPTGLDVSASSGLDIAQDGLAVGVFPEVELLSGVGSVLAPVDLRTGAAGPGVVVNGLIEPVLDLALAPRGAYLP